MGIHAICNACSHLQNAARARLGLTSLPNAKYNLFLMTALHRTGFISSVTRGGPHPPTEDLLMGVEQPEPVTTANVATRRLWVGLKYWNGEPVMRSLQSISKPKRLVNVSLKDLQRIVRGFRVGQIHGLAMGESLFITTSLGVLEAREAVERKVGGLALCRVS